MDRRTMLLLGILGIVGFVLVGDQFGMLSFLDGGVSKHESDLAIIAQQIEKAKEIIHQNTTFRDRLEVYERRSLPYKSEIARSEYQNWLSELIKQNQLAQSAVEVGLPIVVTIESDGQKVEAYKRYAFTVNGVANLEQVTRFLFDFYASGHLQKITTLGLTPSSDGRFNLSVAGEVLGVPSCDRATDLASVPGNRLAHTNLDDYAHIVRRNIFSPEAGATLKQIVLTSVTYDKTGTPEAWFKVGPQRNTEKLGRGGKLNVSVHEIEVIDIQPRTLLVEVDGSLADLRIGMSVHEAISVREVASQPR